MVHEVVLVKTLSRMEIKPTVFVDDDLSTECDSPASIVSIDPWSSYASDEFLNSEQPVGAVVQTPRADEKLESSSMAPKSMSHLTDHEIDVRTLHPDLVAMQKKELEAEKLIQSLESQLATQEREITECFEMQEKTIKQLQQEHEKEVDEMNAVLSKISISRLKARRNKQKQSDNWWDALFGAWRAHCYDIDIDADDFV